VTPVRDLRDFDRSTYVDGSWATGQGGTFDSISPSSGEVIAKWQASSPSQVQEAISAAHRSFDDGVWRSKNPHARAEVLRELARLIEEHAEELSRLIVDEVGSPITLARSLQVGQPSINFRWAADAAERGPRGGYIEHLGCQAGPPASESILVQEPVGVVAAITPYNYPVNMISWKAAPALAAGCSVILLPSPKGTLCTIAFMKLAEQAGLPAGVLNLVTGGSDIGSALTSHPDVDMVTFTGSNQVGAAVMRQAAETNKKVVLELGGKSAAILLPSADFETAVSATVLRFCRNAGQGCGATTRILVPAERMDEFTNIAAAFIRESLPVGDPHDPATEVGPLISAEHLARVQGYIDRSLAEGGRILTGGGSQATPDGGFYLNPTVITGVSPDAEIAQEELFAPVAVVLPYNTVEEAVKIANNSIYGLNALVWGDLEEALAVGQRIQSGTVAINGGGGMRPDVPWSGAKQSGVGAEMGEAGFSEFFRTKHFQWRTAS
jgi:aldehyde dehydrogenase (NAD+)